MTRTQTLAHLRDTLHDRANYLDSIAHDLHSVIGDLLHAQAGECRLDAERAAAAMRDEMVPMPDRRQRAFWPIGAGVRLLVGGAVR